MNNLHIYPAILQFQTIAEDIMILVDVATRSQSPKKLMQLSRELSRELEILNKEIKNTILILEDTPSEPKEEDEDTYEDVSKFAKVTITNRTFASKQSRRPTTV